MKSQVLDPFYILLCLFDNVHMFNRKVWVKRQNLFLPLHFVEQYNHLEGPTESDKHFKSIIELYLSIYFKIWYN